jgi:hypothetical protein
MAELLVRATNTDLGGGVKEARRSYRRGDIVEVRPDGAAHGRNELSNPDNGRALFVLKIPDVTVQQCLKFMRTWEDDLTFVQQAKRRFRVVLDEVPLNIRNTIRDNGFVTLNWAQIRGFIEDKQTALREG